jgi:hypothetical protein
MLGNWTDDKLIGYSVKQFDTFDEAWISSAKYPDIDWLKLILFHKDIYIQLHNIIKSELDINKFMVNFDPHIMTDTEFKEAIFTRVMKYGERFRLAYNMNDILTFNITNSWIANLHEIKNILVNNPALRISKVLEEKYVIHLIGITSIGTSYTISLWTHLIAQWSKWEKSNSKIPLVQKEIALKNVMTAQDDVEKTMRLR